MNTTQSSGIVELWFLAHFCFSLRFDASDRSFHISGPTVSGLEVVCFLVSLSPDHEYPSGVFSFNIVNLVKPVNFQYFCDITFKGDICRNSYE